MRITILLLTASLLIGGCRSVRKDIAKSDSSLSQNSTLQEAYERAIVTEYVEIPVERIIERPGQIIRDTVPVPKIVRQVVYEKGNRKQQTEDKTEILTENKVIDKQGQPPWANGLFGFAFGFVFFVIIYLMLKAAK